MYLIRELELQDYFKDYFQLLSELSNINKSIITFDDWKIHFLLIQQNKFHKIFVIEMNQKIIASITLLIEPKIIRNLSYVCHIEDLVISPNFRKLGIATKLINYALNISKNTFDCYKVILNCDKSLKQFYEKNEFLQKNIEMSFYLCD